MEWRTVGTSMEAEHLLPHNDEALAEGEGEGAAEALVAAARRGRRYADEGAERLGAAVTAHLKGALGEVCGRWEAAAAELLAERERAQGAAQLLRKEVEQLRVVVATHRQMAQAREQLAAAQQVRAGAQRRVVLHELLRQQVVPAFIEFQNKQKPKHPFVEFPRCYFALADGENDIVVMEDVSYKNYKTTNRQDGLNYEQCEILMNVLGRFHALSVAMKEKESGAFKEAVYSLFARLEASARRLRRRRLLRRALAALRRQRLEGRAQRLAAPPSEADAQAAIASKLRSLNFEVVQMVRVRHHQHTALPDPSSDGFRAAYSPTPAAQGGSVPHARNFSSRLGAEVSDNSWLAHLLVPVNRCSLSGVRSNGKDFLPSTGQLEPQQVGGGGGGGGGRRGESRAAAAFSKFLALAASFEGRRHAASARGTPSSSYFPRQSSM